MVRWTHRLEHGRAKTPRRGSLPRRSLLSLSRSCCPAGCDSGGLVCFPSTPLDSSHPLIPSLLLLVLLLLPLAVPSATRIDKSSASPAGRCDILLPVLVSSVVRVRKVATVIFSPVWDLPFCATLPLGVPRDELFCPISTFAPRVRGARIAVRASHLPKPVKVKPSPPPRAFPPKALVCGAVCCG